MSKELLNKVTRALKEQGVTYYEYVYLLGRKLGASFTEVPNELNKWIENDLIESDYLTENKELTSKAIALLDGVSILEQFPDAMEISTEDRVNFDKWWNEYPLNDGHSHHFARQGLRVNPDGCYTAYVDALNDGYTPEQLLNALRKEVAIKKQNSTRRNELTFLPNSYNYLTKKHFIPWINAGDQPNSPSLSVNVQVYGKLA